MAQVLVLEEGVSKFHSVPFTSRQLAVSNTPAILHLVPHIPHISILI